MYMRNKKQYGNLDETTEKGDFSVNRRRVLRTLGMAGGMSVFSSFGINTVAASQNHENRNVTEFNKDKQNKLLNRAKATTDVQSLQTKFTKSGWSPKPDEIRAGFVEPDSSEPHQFLVLPFTKKGQNVGKKSAAIIWKKSENAIDPKISTLGLEIDQRDPTGKHKSDFRATTHKVKQNSIEINQSYFSSHRKSKISNNEASPQAHVPPSGGGNNCMYIDEYCVDFNMSCLFFLAGALGLGCSVNLVSCLATAFLEGGAYITGDGCRVCDERTTEAKRKPMCGCYTCT